MQFEDFYNTYFSKVYNYSRYRSANAAEADELTSLIFEKLLSKFSLFDETRNIEVWLFALARNVVNDYYRRATIRSFFSLGSGGDEDETDVPMPDDTLARAEEEDGKRRLFSALTRLEQRERELINLKHNQMLNNRQIAEVTGLSESNVGTILARSMQKLRVILGSKL